MSTKKNFNSYFSIFLKDKLKQIYYKYIESDKGNISKTFRKKLGREVNLENPIKYNDKIQWLKLYWRDPLAIKYADKYEVRKIIAKKIGKQYLNDLIAVYNSVDEIDLEELPNSFVLKGTHGSGYNIICKDKTSMDWKYEFKKMKLWMNTNYYWSKREWVYKDIKPRIICERYIEQEDNKELRDYRFFCFDGEPKFIAVDLNINNKNETRRNLYDLEWNLLDGEISYPREEKIIIEKPSKLEEMIYLSKKISKPFPHARVDFYQIQNNVIFGEVTFFHQSGMGIFNPPEFEEKVGSFLNLPEPTTYKLL